jgi:hypothetical protein
MPLDVGQHVGARRVAGAQAAGHRARTAAAALAALCSWPAVPAVPAVPVDCAARPTAHIAAKHVAVNARFMSVILLLGWEAAEKKRSRLVVQENAPAKRRRNREKRVKTNAEA